MTHAKATSGDDGFLALERQASKPADELLDGFIIELGKFDTATLEAIAEYRDAIGPNGWLAACIRDYLDAWG